jgi:hypothetical protein
VTIKITPVGNKRAIVQFIPTISLDHLHPRRWRDDARIVKERYFKNS